MGCHTWFGNHEKYVTRRDLSLMKKDIIRMVGKNDKMTYAGFCRFYAELVEDYRCEVEAEIEKYGKCSKSWEITMRDWKNPTKQKWHKFIKKYRYAERLKRKKLSRHHALGIIKKTRYLLWHRKHYYDLCSYGWHDNFRYYDYNQEPLYSMQDVDRLLANTEKKFYIDRETDGDQENVKQQVREICAKFFEQYPHGIICFG